MAYTPPPKSNIPFNFGPGGYQAPDFGDVQFNFNTRVTQLADLQAAINVMPTYQDRTYTFLRYCERYIVGYGQHGVQIIKGRCYYGGIRDLGTDIGGHYPGDLPSFVRGVIYRDLSAVIEAGYQTSDLSAYIRGYREGYKDLPAEIVAKIRAIDLPAYIGGHPPGNLPAYIRGFATEDLPAIARGLVYRNLPTDVVPIPPRDLPAYIKTWPQTDIPGSTHGWDTNNLGGLLNVMLKWDLPAAIGAHPPRDLRGIIRGWVREAYADLPAYISGLYEVDMGAIIRGVEKRDLPAYVFAVRPRYLSAYIRGWQEADLPASIIGDAWPWDLPATIIASGGKIDLPAIIDGRQAVAVFRNLTASILGIRGREDLPAQLYTIYASSLPAYLDTGRDIANLPAYLRPKTIRLTGIVDIITMEHSDLSATISIPCFYSNFSNLNAYMRPVFMSNLIAYIYPRNWAKATADLGARWGYAPRYIVQDKLPITLSITTPGYRVEDKYRIYLNIYQNAAALSAYIFGELQTTDMPASITALSLYPYKFDNYKFRELFYDRTYGQVAGDYQEIDVEFKSIVYDYIYSGAGNFATKTDRYQHFMTKISSYYSDETSYRIDRKLHKTRILYGLDHFSSIDEAVRYAIHYVTTDFHADLRSIITSLGHTIDLSARLNPIYTRSTSYDLSSNITATLSHPFDVVLAYTEDGVGYLQFN